MTNYYVRTDGNDANDGSADDAAHAWLTLGHAYVTATAAANNTIYVAAGNYYDEVVAIGGPDAGYTWTFQFAAGQTNIRRLNADSGYIFRTLGTGTTIFQGGSTGWPKVTKFDIGYYKNGDPVSVAATCMVWCNTTAAWVFNDVEISGDGSQAAKTMWCNALSSMTYLRCFIHGTTRTSNPGTATFYLQASFVVDCTDLTIGAGAGNVYIRNNTFYNSTVNSVVVAFAVGANSGEIIITNNLNVSDIAAATIQYFVSIDSGVTFTNLTLTNNIGWKTAAPDAPRDVNNYIRTYDADALVPNNIIAVDPTFTGNTTTPTVGATSLTIGRGTTGGPSTDIGNVAYPSNSIGCYAVVGGTKQYLTRANKTILIAGDSLVYETPMAAKFGALLAADPDFTGFTFIKMPGDANCLPGISGGTLCTFRGMITELTQANSPSVIVFDGGVNDILAATPWTGALVGRMHKELADDLDDLYAPGDKPIIISIITAEDGNTPVTADSDAAEAVIGPYFQTQGYRAVMFVKHAKKCAGGVADLYTAPDNIHPDATGWAFLTELVKAAILSEQYITGDSVTKSYQALKDTSNAAFGFKYGLTIAGDTATIYNVSISGFTNDGLKVQGDSPTIKNCVASGNGTAVGDYYNFNQSLTGATLAVLGDIDYNDWRGEYYVNGVDTADEAHDITGDPLFTSAVDLHLQTGSPCINAGVDVGLTQDIESNLIVGLPDMGAYQSAEVASSQTTNISRAKIYSKWLGITSSNSFRQRRDKNLIDLPKDDLRDIDNKLADDMTQPEFEKWRRSQGAKHH